MAAEFLASHGVDLQHEMSKIQFPASPKPDSPPPLDPLTCLSGVLFPSSTSQLYDVHISPTSALITSIEPHFHSATSPSLSTLSCTSCLALPSLCHPHIHLDKAYLYSHPIYSSLRPRTGSFSEALSLTSKAKALYTPSDLLERGNWLIAESVSAGVTHMRAFVEVDTVVGMKCVEAGLQLKKEWEGRCEVQICVFAQDPVFGSEEPTREEEGEGRSQTNKSLMEKAVDMEGVEAIGSTPYVEMNEEQAKRNVEWVVQLAIRKMKHLDLHLDYNLDPQKEALVWFVLEMLRREEWGERAVGRTVCLGHCTRLTLFGKEEWERLKKKAEGLRVNFVGLPTSDLFMMGRPDVKEGWKDRGRGTLQIPWMIKELSINAAIGVNNVGNAFTPQGSADPLTVASLGVGLYQAGTGEDAALLYECVSTRAREAIGYGRASLSLAEGDITDLAIYGLPQEKETRIYRRRKTVQEIVYDAGTDRITIKNGHHISL